MSKEKTTTSSFNLSSMDVTEASENGVWFQPVDLEGGKLPIEILVFGEDSVQYSQAMDRINRSRKARAKSRRGTSDIHYDEIKEASWVLASRLSGGFRHADSKEAITVIESHDTNFDVTQLAGREALYQRMSDLADQAVSHSREQSNFLGR